MRLISGIRVIAAVRTDIGAIRHKNEDNFYFLGETLAGGASNEMKKHETSLPSRFAMAVCDGLGGTADGEYCSRRTVELLKRHEYNICNSIESSFPKVINAFIQEANDAICAHIHEIGEHCGTTLAMLVFDKTGIYSVNIGDSRVYRLHGNSLIELSIKDSEERTRSNGSKTQHMTQCIGIPKSEFRITPHISRRIKLKRNDKYLICSDGVTEALDDDQIRKLLSSTRFPSEAVNSIVDASLEAGSKDNITALAVFIS